MQNKTFTIKKVIPKDFKFLCNLNQIKSNHINYFAINDKGILIIKKEENYYAVSSTCLHMGANLAKGKLEKNYIECPWHGCRFNFETGKSLNNNLELTKFDVFIKEQSIYLNIK